MPRPLRNERVGLSLATALVVGLPLAIAWAEASKPPADSALAWVAGAWLVGVLVGLATFAYQARRGRLIIRDPEQVKRNQVSNRTIGVVTVPLAVGFVLALGGTRIYLGLDPVPLVIAAICGFMLPLMVVVLYITFRLRPDELRSSDPQIAEAAARRLRGDS